MFYREPLITNIMWRNLLVQVHAFLDFFCKLKYWCSITCIVMPYSAFVVYIFDIIVWTSGFLPSHCPTCLQLPRNKYTEAAWSQCYHCEEYSDIQYICPMSGKSTFVVFSGAPCQVSLTNQLLTSSFPIKFCTKLLLKLICWKWYVTC